MKSNLSVDGGYYFACHYAWIAPYRLMNGLALPLFNDHFCCCILANMKKSPLSIPAEQTVADLAHFAWCALMGLRLAQQNSQTDSAMMCHTFLVRWLALAQKQRRFPRTVATDIESLLQLGRQKGVAAGLEKRLEYLWQSCSSPLPQQSDLFRLTFVIETLKAQGWVNAVVEDDEWVPEQLQAEYVGQSALLVRKSALGQGFSDGGKLHALVAFLVVGDVDTVTTFLNAQCFPYCVDPLHAGGRMVMLLPA